MCTILLATLQYFDVKYSQYNNFSVFQINFCSECIFQCDVNEFVGFNCRSGLGERSY